MSNKRTLQLYFTFLIILSLPLNQLVAQCSIGPCISITCGDLNTSFGSEGGVLFCDGNEISLPNNSVPGFDFFVLEWGDGTIDTIYDYDAPTHTYNIPEDELCDINMSSFFTVCFIGYRICDEGISCHRGTYDFGIRPRPKADFEVSQELCVNTDINISDLSCNASTYSWDFGDGNTSTAASPNHSYDTPGTYTINLEVSNDCGTDTHSMTVEVVGQPEAVIDYSLDPANGCHPVIGSFTDNSNQWSTTRWEITPDTPTWCFTEMDMTLNDEFIEVDFKIPQMYEVTLIASNACGEDIATENIDIYEIPVINITSPGSFCDAETISVSDLNLQQSGTIDSYTWTFTTPSGTESVTGENFGTHTFTESGTIQLAITSPCGPDMVEVPITIATTAPISFITPPTELCQNNTPVQLMATPAGTWSGIGAAANAAITGQGELDPSLLSPGTYTFRYSAGSDLCPNDADIQIEILPGVSVMLEGEDPVCESLAYEPDVSFAGDIDSYNWSFPGGTPSSSSQMNPGIINFPNAGTFEVIVEVTGACGTDADTITLEIQPNTPLSITPVANPVCSGSDPITLQANTNNGTWSGTGIIDEDQGIFDPGAVTPGGTYTITYQQLNGACTDEATTQIEVTPSLSVNITDTLVCIDDAPITLQATPSGGTWLNLGADSLTGVFDPAIFGEGSFPMPYQFIDNNNCAVTGTGTVQVNALPTLGLADTIQLCLSDIDVDLDNAFGINPDPTGGNTTWSGPGVVNGNTFNAQGAGLSTGFYTMSVDYELAPCLITNTAVVEVINVQPLVLSPDTIVCISGGSLFLETNLNGGQWSPGSQIDPGTGEIIVGDVGDGTFTFTYSYLPGTSCFQEDQVTVEIIDLSGIVNAGPAFTEVCEGPASFQLTGASPSGGTWSGDGITDPASGLIDLTTLVADSVYTYQYCIESTLAVNCSACASRTFIIHSNPIADFAIDGLACINQSFGLDNLSTDAITYIWDMDDGTEYNSVSPTHSYTNQGTYSINLIATSADGCQDTTSLDLYVTTPPVASFDLSSDEGCAPFEVDITNNSFGDSIMQVWYIADDTLFTSEPSNIFLDDITQDSTFDILLVVSNFCGEVQAIDSVLVHPYPRASFGVNEDEGCSPVHIEFSNTSLGNADTYFWDLGNGVTSTDSLPPDQFYTTSDTAITVYTISLIAENECGIDTFYKDITVYPPDINAFIELDTLFGCEPLTFTLENYSTPGAIPSWKFIAPDGSESGSEESNPEVTFSGAGTHTIILYASRCGTDTDTAFVDILPAPSVSFSHRPFICVGESVQFFNESDSISGSNWDFGDGNTSSDHSPVHIFDSAGTYTISLTAYSLGDGCPNTSTSEIEVIGTPDAAFTPSVLSGCPPLTITFSNESTGSSSLNTVWDFGDGSSASFEESPTHTFTTPGMYQVLLTVSDIDSCFSDTTITNIFVFDRPESNFIAEPLTPCQGYDTLRPLDQSTNAVSWNWSFAGQSSNLQSPSFNTDQAGAILLSLIVENSNQCRDTSTQIINVRPIPMVNADILPIEGCQPLVVTGTALSTQNDWNQWSFGNGDVSTDTAPQAIYTEAGTYQLQLIAGTNNGCPNDTLTQTITVRPKPEADFSFDNPFQCGTPSMVTFTNLSSDNDDNSWNFGDGGQSEASNPVYDYELPGTYDISLEVTNTFGCTDTAFASIDVFGAPVAGFTLPFQASCAPASMTIENTSTDANEYEWHITGFPLITDPTPVLDFPEPGVYEIELIAKYNEFCQDTLSSPVRIYVQPTADFSFEADVSEDTIGEIQFHNESIDENRVQWYLGDGTVTTEEDPFHEYFINRDIDVTLVAIQDNNGQFLCTDTITKPVAPEWIKGFYAPNAMTPDNGNGKIRVFRPVGIGIQSYSIAVFSPYGEQVWYSEALRDGQPDGEWDGTYKGEPMPQGTYTWRADVLFDDGTNETYVGDVTVIR